MERARYIADLLLIHAEELEFLWGQRRAALTSADYTLHEFRGLGERIEAHLQGLLVVPEALPALLGPRFDAPERDAVFTAAYAWLRHGEPQGVGALLPAFASAEGGRLDGLRDAMAMAPRGPTVAALWSQYREGALPQAAAAAVVLANRRWLESGSARLSAILNGGDVQAAALAWRVVPLADTPEAAAGRPFAAALSQGPHAVRAAALEAAAWTGQPWLLSLVRRLAADGDRLAAAWLAVLGTPQDLPFLLRCGRSAALGKDRYPLLARYGHPQALELTLEALEDPDPALAAAAGEAFTRMTGIDVRGERVTLAVAADADDFAREFAPTLWLPNARLARHQWQQHRARWQSGTRWCRGLDLDAAPSPALLDTLDLASRWDAGARAASRGPRIIDPPPIYC